MRKAMGLVVVLFAGCAEPSTGDVKQQVADPAPTFAISSVAFSNVLGGTNVTFCGQAGYAACATAPNTQVRWGEPAFATEQSGLGFDAAAAHVVTYTQPFALGALTHFNFPTYSGTWAAGTNLDLHLTILPSVAGPAIFDSTISIPLAIDETPNEEPCTYASTSPCSDKITFGTSTFQLASATSTTVYDLQITGFIDPATNTTVDGLISEESASTSATLMGLLREHCIDTDNDGVCDETPDNCIDTPNADQADTDHDGQGDVCDICPTDPGNDADGDGVCGAPDPCPCDADWKNHGEYVSCVAHATQDQVNAGELTHQERSAIVSAAGQSSCGK